MVVELPSRADVAPELKWDLTLIYATDDEAQQALVAIKRQAGEFKRYQGTLKQGGEALLKALQALLALNRQAEKLYVYAEMKNDQDTTNAQYQGLFAQAEQLLTTVAQQTAWFQPELVQLTDEQLEQALADEPGLREYRHLLEQWTSERDHVLPEKQEHLLAGAQSVFGGPERIFGTLSNSDLDLGTVTDADGVKRHLSDGVYGQLLEATDPRVRKEAFTQLYRVYKQFAATFATTLATHVQMHNYTAQVHHYPDARTAALAENHIPVSVYDQLVDQVTAHLDLLHRYVRLRKRVLGQPVHMYDMYVPLTGEPSLKFTYDEAKEMALKALAVLGDDYCQHVQEAFDQRWIDVVENKGKRSGAYSSGTYDTAPYILLNWQDTLENLFTLVHEMGHSMHSYYTTHTQPYQYGDYAIFVAEIASTTNENLLTQYLLKTQKDPAVRAYVLNHYLDGFKGTVFRQTQFAQFEQWLHEQDAAGQPLTAQRMAKYYGQLNQKYYGDAVENDPQIAYEWARIPHFYYDFYVYQYATGFAAATTLAQNILDDDPQHTAAYLDYLKAGSSDYPLNVMRRAGVDMTQPAYLERAFAVFEKRLTTLEQLLGVNA